MWLPDGGIEATTPLVQRQPPCFEINFPLHRTLGGDSGRSRAVFHRRRQALDQLLISNR